MKIKITIITVIIFALNSPVSYSQNACQTNDFKKLLKTPIEALLQQVIVKTASQYPEHLGDTPANILVINQTQIQERAYRNLLDLLKDQPSIDIQSYSTSTRLHITSIRGLSNDRNYLILQDGVRIRTPDGDNLAITDNFPLHFVERVEILYGPASAIYGADAFTGVINLISKTSKKASFNIGLSQGIDQNYRYASGQTGAKNDWNFAAGAHKQTQNLSKQLLDDYPENYTITDAVGFSGETIIPASERQPFSLQQSSNSAFARINYKDNFSVNFFHSELKNSSNISDKPSTSLYDNDAFWQNRIDSLSMRYQHTINSKLNTETNLQYLEHQLSNQSQFKNIFTGFNSGYKYAKGTQWQFSQNFDYCWNSKQHLVGGFSYESTYALPRTTDLPAPYDTDKSATTQGYLYDKTDLPIQIKEASYQNIGAYLQLHSKWNNKVSTVLGVRIDKNSQYTSSINPRLGIIYKASPNTLVKLLYGQAFRAPTAHEMLRQFGSFSGERNDKGEYISNFFAVPNYDLKPETLSNLELNIYHVVNKKFNMQWSLYYNQINNLINSVDSNNPDQFIANAQILSGSSNENLGNANTYGFDYQLNYQQSLDYGWKMKLWGNYSYINGSIDSKNTGIETDLPFISPHKLKLGATFNYRRKYFITPKLYIIGKTNTAQLKDDNAAELIRTPSYIQANLHMGAKNILQNKGLNFYIDIENLADTRYYHAGGITTETSFVKIPQIGRRIMFSLGWQF